ncbi:MAG: hypothetical protein Q8R56_00310, partial [Polaromonas sp.]|nr:hypothetical protein [Polaromonas sp.]
MQRIAASMADGMITAPLLPMFVIPAAYLLMRRPRKSHRAGLAFWRRPRAAPSEKRDWLHALGSVVAWLCVVLLGMDATAS